MNKLQDEQHVAEKVAARCPISERNSDHTHHCVLCGKFLSAKNFSTSDVKKHAITTFTWSSPRMS